MKKKLFIILVILLAAIGGFFYWLWQKPAPEGPQPPTLFSKEDYQIEEREDGKYILIDKIGFSAKIPDGWTIEKQKTSDIEPQYWVDISSPDSKIENSILVKECGISIVAGIAEENYEELKQEIEILRENPAIEPKEISSLYEDYELEIIKVKNYFALKWIAPENKLIGQARGVDIPLLENKLLSLDTLTPPGYKEKCLPIWEEFLENIEIK